jgi:hypothetical protein
LHIQPLDPPALDHALSAAQGPTHRHGDGTDDAHGRAPDVGAYEEQQQAAQERPSPLQPRTHRSSPHAPSEPVQSPEPTEPPAATHEPEDPMPTPIDPQVPTDPLSGALAEERHRIAQRRVQLEAQIELIETELETLTVRLGHVDSLIRPEAPAA